MKFYSADDYGAYGRAKEEATRGEAGRFFALAQAARAAQERAQWARVQRDVAEEEAAIAGLRGA